MARKSGKANSLSACITPTNVTFSKSKDACFSCRPGSISGFGASTCTACPAGKYSKGSSNVCTLCPSGTYGDRTAAGACTPCPENGFSSPGSTVCGTCTLPQIPTSDGAACQDCPKGMVCQLDGQVLTCPPGTYGPGTGFTSLDQCTQCPPNQVCTDPATAEQCPPNTHSVPGATSMLQCECDYGFDCSYTKSVRGKVVIPIEPEQFDEAMRTAFIQAIADSAGVSPDRVRIISIEKVTTMSTRSVSRQVRQPSKSVGGARTQVIVRVIGAGSLNGVDSMLRKYGLPRTITRSRVSRDHHVEARRKPRGQGGWI